MFQTASSSDMQDMRCPDCADPLVPFTYAYSSDILLHRCSACRGIWADCRDLLRIEELLTGYKESLDEAKAKALPLMLKVKKQIQQEERAREEEQKQHKKGFFNRLFKQKKTENRKVHDLFEDIDLREDADKNPEDSE
jgi:Zn-finger nucleic acid-binding protein